MFSHFCASLQNFLTSRLTSGKHFHSWNVQLFIDTATLFNRDAFGNQAKQTVLLPQIRKNKANKTNNNLLTNFKYLFRDLGKMFGLMQKDLVCYFHHHHQIERRLVPGRSTAQHGQASKGRPAWDWLSPLRNLLSSSDNDDDYHFQYK